MGFVEKIDTNDLIFQKNYNPDEHDRIVRCFLVYKYYINIERLQDSLLILLKELPILNSVFQEDDGKYYWVEREDTSEIFFIHDSWTSFYDDWTYSFDFAKKPQFKINSFQANIGISLNNMVADVFGLKTIIARLVEIYNHLDEKDYKPVYSHVLSRKFADFIKLLPFSTKIKKILPFPLSNKGFNETKLEFTSDTSLKEVYVSVATIYKKMTSEIFRIARKDNILVSTVLNTAYLRTVARICKKYDAPINIGLQLDGRSEIKNEKYYVSVNNIHAILPLSVTIGEKEDFMHTLKKVNAIVNKIKNGQLVSRKIFKNTKHFVSNTNYLQFCNIGSGTNEDYSFKDNELMQIFFTTAARNIPFFCLTAGYFNEQIFYCSSSFIGQEDHANIDYFNNLFKYELEMFIFGGNDKFFIEYNETDDYTDSFGLPNIYLNPKNNNNENKAKENTPVAKDISKKEEIKVNTPIVEEVKNKNVEPEKVKEEKKIDFPFSNVTKAKEESKTKPEEAVVDSYVNNDKWNEKQNLLAKQYFQLTNNKLIDSEDGKVKYKSGKTYQKRTWDEIEKFIQYKTNR